MNRAHFRTLAKRRTAARRAAARSNKVFVPPTITFPARDNYAIRIDGELYEITADKRPTPDARRQLAEMADKGDLNTWTYTRPVNSMPLPHLRMLLDQAISASRRGQSAATAASPGLVTAAAT